MQHKRVGSQVLFKLFGLFSLFVLVTSVLNAGSFDGFKRTNVQVFVEYKDDRDSEFHKTLKSQWLAYSIDKEVKLYSQEKPKHITKAQLSTPKAIGPVITIRVDDLKLVIKDEVTINTKGLKKNIKFNFLGSSLAFNISKDIKYAKFYPKDQIGVSNFFDILASSEHEYLIEEINSISKEMNLNDWGVYLLVLKLSDEIFVSKDDSRLFSWFLFNKLGYAVKVGLANEHIILLHYCEQTIYSTPSYSFSDKSFYILDENIKDSVPKLVTYKENYPESVKGFDFSLKTLPNLEVELKSKTISFNVLSKKYTITYEYNQNLINFMEKYPQVDPEIYFNAPMDILTYTSVAKELKKYLDYKQISYAINFVLHFVQNAFVYESDMQQFSKEKFMFAQETLYYDKSDSEDRAVLFSYLFKKLFNIGVIGIKYSNHINTGIYVPMQGDKVKKGSKEFIIADPSYKNANIGQSMLKYKNNTPEIFIDIKKD